MYTNSVGLRLLETLLTQSFYIVLPSSLSLSVSLSLSLSLSIFFFLINQRLRKLTTDCKRNYNNKRVYESSQDTSKLSLTLYSQCSCCGAEDLAGQVWYLPSPSLSFYISHTYASAHFGQRGFEPHELTAQRAPT